jgi:hypothetical protein
MISCLQARNDDRTPVTYGIMARSTLSETEKMQKVRGIVFAGGPAGRRARVAGTGIEVFEIIKMYREFPEEIDERLAREAQITPEYIRAKYLLKRGPHARLR